MSALHLLHYLDEQTKIACGRPYAAHATARPREVTCPECEQAIAVAFVAAIRGNVASYDEARAEKPEERSAYQAFTAAQDRTWGAVRGAGRRIEDRVLEILRTNLPPIPSDLRA